MDRHRSRYATAAPLVAALVAGMGLLTACSASGTSTGSPTGNPSSTSGATVVVTTSILGDVTGQIVACGGGTTTVLMPPGTDPHDFSPSSEQVASLVTSDLVVANGLGLEPGLTGALDTARTDGAQVLEVGNLVEPLPGDPHFWMDMSRMATAATAIGQELSDVTGNAAYTDCATTVADEISAAEAAVKAKLDAIPAGQRILVTDHEALGYLAHAYDYEIVGTVIPAATTLAEPSSADLADLAAVIRERGVPAIFSNAGQPAALAEAVAAEVGADVSVVPLYVESLGAPDSPASTYVGMMTENARLISEALGGR